MEWLSHGSMLFSHIADMQIGSPWVGDPTYTNHVIENRDNTTDVAWVTLIVNVVASLQISDHGLTPFAWSYGVGVLDGTHGHNPRLMHARENASRSFQLLKQAPVTSPSGATHSNCHGVLVVANFGSLRLILADPIAARPRSHRLARCTRTVSRS